MKFNKWIIGLTAALALCFGTSVATAQTHQTLNFIGSGGDTGSANGQSVSANGYLKIGAFTTNSFGSSTLAYAMGSYVTNVLTAITNSANGLVITGYVSQVTLNYVTNASGISDVNLWCDRDGTTPSLSIQADVNGLNAAFTNTVTFNFATVSPNGLASTAAQNQWQFSVTGNGTTDVVISTNVPGGLIQGVKRLRLTSVASSGVGIGGTNGTVVGLWLTGYKPVGQE